jgi:hypothetical protein
MAIEPGQEGTSVALLPRDDGPSSLLTSHCSLLTAHFSLRFRFTTSTPNIIAMTANKNHCTA